MTLTNPLTIAINWTLAGVWALVVGAAALRTLGYTLHSMPLAMSLGAVGLLLGYHWFPRGLWDFPWWSFPFTLSPLAGYCWALAIAGIYRGFDWWMARENPTQDAPP